MSFMSLGRAFTQTGGWKLELMVSLSIIAVACCQLGLSASSPQKLGKRKNPTNGLTYVWIEPGKFDMGCSEDDDECIDGETPSHSVTITKGFWIGETEVTQEAYEKLFPNLRNRFEGPQLPVDSASWDEARAYCDALGMRLPTEAEYEYAARAGTKGPRYGAVSGIAWFDMNSHGKTREVRTLGKNPWELYDMLGNVWEWVNDWYGTYPKDAKEDPKGPPTGYNRVLRGGSANSGFSSIRLSTRLASDPSSRGGASYFGFRCAANANDAVKW